ncbi:hypothetical protein J2Z69_000920 [Paenibacillus shirakamiensis]|uniref:Uracil-DNA glycosylase-like domain-containing protein n=1 Tax=Paenibacillus shirakamiensis TaxID=1265935 RepID=A0ABS4JG07_9BACL|nr:uracil-DNA glycosylase family protein [Paenibacillus shirakamiensis]MBP1999901.1 hypothetical protein [Paenibacillus shirakamiensis]
MDMFLNYKSAIWRLPLYLPLTKRDLLVPEFEIHRESMFCMYYAPHNEYINRKARVFIVGLTPGWTQMKLAFEEARCCLEHGDSDENVLRKAKQAARFAGSMRTNLSKMLDVLGLQDQLQISSTLTLFQEHQDLLHTTSVLQFPVFVNEKNYTGAHPVLLSNKYLRERAISHITQEIQRLGPVLIIPLGKSVETILYRLDQEGRLQGNTVLWNFPHPSGANGHRHQQFAEHKQRMKQKLCDYFAGYKN